MNPVLMKVGLVRAMVICACGIVSPSPVEPCMEAGILFCFLFCIHSTWSIVGAQEYLVTK